MAFVVTLLLIVTITVGFLCSFIFSNFFRSFLNSKVLAICMPNNVLLYSHSFVLQIQNLLCCVLLVTQHVLQLSKYVLLCFGFHLQRIITVVSVCFYLSISVTGYIEKFNPGLYGRIQPRTMEMLSIITGVLSTIWYFLGRTILFENWAEPCATHEDCDRSFRSMTMLTIMVFSVIVALTASKSWLSKAFHRRSQVHPSPEVNNVEQIEVTNSEEGSKEMVNIAVHTLTFFVVFIFFILSMIACRHLGFDCQDASIKLVFALVNTALQPAVWVLAKPEIRNHAWRQLKSFLHFW